jgi:hypothetical protein
MENTWLMAQSLGISVHILSVFSGDALEREVKRILHIPGHMKIAFASLLECPIPKPTRHLTVRRDIETFFHYNQFGNKGFG